ncbi:MAG: thiamine diphosphokinase [Syntrophomonadaceae bacterium]|nr:thiamine diphosphokinase [Syntrophomonadaceae bacterium]
MKCIIFANGEYEKDMDSYARIIEKDDLIICADGGANYAYKLNLKPHCIVGDMDSIYPDVESYYAKLNVPVKKYPRRKNSSDTQLSLSEAEEAGIKDIIVLGSLGKRLDHSMANIYGSIKIVNNGFNVMHYTKDMILYVINNSLELHGRTGDLVSVLALTDKADGVSETGFEYPLEKAALFKETPYAISNLITAEKAVITVEQGVLAVMHYVGYADHPV